MYYNIYYRVIFFFSGYKIEKRNGTMVHWYIGTLRCHNFNI